MAFLTKEEERVIGCLIEKEYTTPEYYPLTLNALKNACNQKSNREPVVNYSESDVDNVIEALFEKKMVFKVPQRSLLSLLLFDFCHSLLSLSS